MLAMGLTTIPYSSDAWGRVRVQTTPDVGQVNNENIENFQQNQWAEQAEDEADMQEEVDNIFVVTFRNTFNNTYSITSQDADGSNLQHHNAIAPNTEITFQFNGDTDRQVIFTRTFTRGGREHELRFTFYLKELAPNSTVRLSSGEKYNSFERRPNDQNNPQAQADRAVRRLNFY